MVINNNKVFNKLRTRVVNVKTVSSNSYNNNRDKKNLKKIESNVPWYKKPFLKNIISSKANNKLNFLYVKNRGRKRNTVIKLTRNLKVKKHKLVSPTIRISRDRLIIISKLLKKLNLLISNNNISIFVKYYDRIRDRKIKRIIGKLLVRKYTSKLYDIPYNINKLQKFTSYRDFRSTLLAKILAIKFALIKDAYVRRICNKPLRSRWRSRKYVVIRYLKRRINREGTKAICYMVNTYSNLFLCLKTVSGKLLASLSVGHLKQKTKRQGLSTASAIKLGSQIGDIAIRYNVKVISFNVKSYLKNFFVKPVVRSMFSKGIRIFWFVDMHKIAHNGCRVKKKRRK